MYWLMILVIYVKIVDPENPGLLPMVIKEYV